MEKFSQVTSNIENVKKQETESSFLSEWDKKYLEKGSLGMISTMYNDFENNFPDVIVLPERGARPLYYLLNPIFHKLNIEKKTKIPKFIYFSVGKKAGINLTIQEQYADIKTSYELKEMLEKDYPDLPIDSIQRLVDGEEVEKVITARENMKSRAEEINKLNKNDLKLVIVDEVLSNGGTIREIKRAFNNEKIPAYTLIAFSSSDNSATPGYTFNDEDDSKNPGVDGYSFSFEHSEDAIGVKKSFEQKYSTNIKKDSPDEQEKLMKDKKLLRVEMKAFGNELADKISEVI
jgi:hypothetical protein